MTTPTAPTGRPAVAEYALRLGDDALVAAQRLAEWAANAPEMELDIALANIALDQLGVARLLLSYAGEATDRDEDALAYLREPHEFRNCLLVELPNGADDGPADFGITMAKLLALSAYQSLTYDWLADHSTDERLAAIAAKARKESAYHLDQASLWTRRLGDGTDESRVRMQAAIDGVWPYTEELFDADPLAAELAAAGVAPDPVTLRPQWADIVETVVAEATLTRPASGMAAPGGGRSGRHTGHLATLLAEMQRLHRDHPGARW
jgi:ring-1,2-phenylacetyl-CoA epoxidase subunit PaaC